MIIFYNEELKMANKSESQYIIIIIIIIIIIKRITKDQFKENWAVYAQLRPTVPGILQSEKVQIYYDN